MKNTHLGPGSFRRGLRSKCPPPVRGEKYFCLPAGAKIVRLNSSNFFVWGKTWPIGQGNGSIKVLAFIFVGLPGVFTSCGYLILRFQLARGLQEPLYYDDDDKMITFEIFRVFLLQRAIGPVALICQLDYKI